MRTTVRLDSALLRAAKKYAAETGVSLTALIEDGLREVLGRRVAGHDEVPCELPVAGRGGLRKGVALDDSGRLRDAMDA